MCVCVSVYNCVVQISIFGLFRNLSRVLTVYYSNNDTRRLLAKSFTFCHFAIVARKHIFTFPVRSTTTTIAKHSLIQSQHAVEYSRHLILMCSSQVVAVRKHTHAAHGTWHTTHLRHDWRNFSICAFRISLFFILFDAHLLLVISTFRLPGADAQASSSNQHHQFTFRRDFDCWKVSQVKWSRRFNSTSC